MPNARRAGASVAVMAAVVSALALDGCAGAAESPATQEPTVSSGTGVVGPVIVDLDEIDGTRVEVAVGETVDLTGDDEASTEWMAEIADERVVEFIPGRDDGSAQFNPGLDALAPGTTEVTLDNAETGKTVTFTVEVRAA